jgi:hypothetical protein
VGEIGAVQNLMNSLTLPLGLPRVDVGRMLNTYGGTVIVEEHVNDWLGGVFDFGGTYGNRHVNLSNVALALGAPPGTSVQMIFRPSTFTYSGGPQIHSRKHEHVQPFARVLVGGAHADLGPDSPTAAFLQAVVPTFRTSSDSFALIGGAGVDYVWKPLIAFRVSGDYVRTWLFNDHQNTIRVMVGMNFRFHLNPTGF